MDGSNLDIRSILAPLKVESGGSYIPFSRNDLMLLMRSRDDAEGESRMMGSVLLRSLGFPGVAFPGIVAAGVAPPFVTADTAVAGAGRPFSFRKTCVSLRT